MDPSPDPRRLVRRRSGPQDALLSPSSAMGSGFKHGRGRDTTDSSSVSFPAYRYQFLPSNYLIHPQGDLRFASSVGRRDSDLPPSISHKVRICLRVPGLLLTESPNRSMPCLLTPQHGEARCYGQCVRMTIICITQIQSGTEGSTKADPSSVSVDI